MAILKNEYKEDDGSISVGDYDMVPLIDRFVEEHPDFSYHGHKGIIALTGYNGILGYRTDIAYKTRKDLDEYQEKFFEENPDFDKAAWKKERQQAKKCGRCHERRRMGVCKSYMGTYQCWRSKS